MDWGFRLAVAVIGFSLLFLAGFSPVLGFGGDGNASFQDAPDCSVPTGVANSCFNDMDDNSHDGADANDAACAKPIEPCVSNEILDRTEGNIWDTDLSRTLAEEGAETSSESPESEGIMFSGSVIRGPRPNDNTFKESDSSSSTSVTEQWIDEARPEQSDPNDNDWAFGDDRTNIIAESQFPAGTEFESGRAVYPPNELADSDERCGDGLENEPEPQGNDATLGPQSPEAITDPDANTDSETTDCRSDYGRIHEKNDIREVFGKEDISCSDDSATADAQCTGDSISCGSCTSDSCSCEGQVDTNRCYQDGTEYHYLSGDTIGKETCTDDGGTVDSDTATKDVCETDGNCGCSICTGPGGSSYPCNCDTAYKHTDEDSDTCYRGDTRGWTDDGQQVNCNDHNTVDGGSSDGSTNSEGTQHDRNDEAATYTEFTAYSDTDWTAGDGGSETYDTCSGGSDGESSSDSPDGSQTGSGRAWCAFEYTVTIDADGPKGYGDGFVVVENRGPDGKYSSNPGDWSIVATEAHNGNDEVGDRIWVATREFGDGSQSGSFMSARSKMRNNNNIMSCPGSKEVCLKYVDYWTVDSGWTATAAGNNYKSAVRVDQRHELTPDRSYSVCKNINRIARQNGNADGDLVRCDYVREDAGSPGGVERVTPLPEACGDDPHERLIASEGIEVDEEEMEDYLAFHQECFEYPDDPDDVNNVALDDDVDAGTYGSGGPSSTDSAYLQKEWISRVDFKEIGYGSGADTTDGYQDFTGNTETTLRRGDSQRLYIEFGVDSGAYPEKASAWIDFDGDNNLEPSERFDIKTDNDDISGGETEFVDINVPNSADLGYTLMRVSIRDGSMPPATTTASWTYGETEDYSVRIRDTEASEENITTGACVLNGKVYPEGTVKNVADVPQFRSKFTGFEAGGDSNDKEVCLDIDSTNSENGEGNLGTEVDDFLDWKYPGDRDKGGEWWDIDNWRATEYVRNHDLDSKDYEELWMDNPDKNASTDSYGPKSDITGVEPEYTNDRGFALEDDCAATIGNERIECEDRGPNTGRLTPVFARFTEGARDDDYNFGESRFQVNLPNYHNRVQNGGATGHAESQPLSRSTMVVETESDWNQGETFVDTEVDGSFLDTTESVGSADREGVVMSGINVFGWYESKVFDKTPETVFTNIRVLNEFSGGDHPLVVEMASDEDFTQDTSTQEFLLNSQYESENFTLTASPDQRYLRFKVGIGEEEVPSQVAFVVDETGSMGSVQDQIQTRAKDFMDRLGPGSEGAVIGINNYESWRTHGTANIYQKFTTNTQDVKDAIDNLQASGGEEATGKGIRVGVNELDWNSGFSKAMIYVQEGNGCNCPINPDSDSRTDLQNKDITFYNVEDGSVWHDELMDLVSATGGDYWEAPGDWDQIFNQIESELTKLPEEPLTDRVEITATTPPTSGYGNTQDEEPLILNVRGHPEYLEWHENAEIDSQDDEWAYTPEMDWGIANNGTAWPPGRCWGAPREQGIDKNKEDATYANSYLRGNKVVRDTNMFAEPKEDGNWINPDDDTASVISGGVTCDLTGHDWGYAVQNDTYSGIDCLEGDCDQTGNPSSPGTEGVEFSIPHEIVVDPNDFTWDMDTNPGDKDQNDLQQWKNACGDDRNEYLIREHAADIEGEYNPTFAGREDYYACADRPTDCVLDGEVYSEGQIVDVSDITQETGVQSEDQEICLDRVDALPGGEWYDVDNQNIRSDLIGTGIVEDPEIFVREGEIDEDRPHRIFWHNASTQDPVRDEALREARDSPYSPLGGNGIYGTGIDYWRGYALEDDCDSDLGSGCDDKGVDETRGTDDDPSSDLIYSPFRENKDDTAVKGDDYSTEDSWVVRMYVDGSTAHGSNTGQMNENTPGVNFDSTDWGWPTADLNDSKIDSDEDTWAVASEPYDAVGPTGTVYDTGQCHGSHPPQHSEGWVEKNETVMANSFAKREDVNSDPRDEGNWVDPDTTERTVSRGGLSCDLNSTDWGIGYNLGPGSSLNVYEGDARYHGYEVADRHVVSGPITFDMNSDPLGGNQDNLQQHPDACGDDKNEYLIREQRTLRGNEIDPDLQARDDIYVCADRITDCAYDGEVYSEGQTVDISERSPSATDPEHGDDISDEEICLDLDKTTPGGEWYDKDQDLTVQNRIIGLEDTFDVPQGPDSVADTFTLQGEVVDSTGGYIDINGRIISVDSDGEFSDSVSLPGGTVQRIDYLKAGEIQAQKRLVLPGSSTGLDDIVISTELAYNGWQVWNRMEWFLDHDFDRNNIDPAYNGTDWRSQSTQYDRTELEYFNNQDEKLGGPAATENVRGKFTEYYSPEGYATEDDCGPLLSESGTGPCGDIGAGTQDNEWFSAGNFSVEGEGVPP